MAAGATLAWAIALRPSTAAMRSLAGVIVTTFTPQVSLIPARTRHAVFDLTRPLVLPGTQTPLERTLTVTGDFRVTLAG